MSNSRTVSETELDSNSNHKTEHTISTTGSATQPEYEHTYVHSLKTLAYLAWVGWPKPKVQSPKEDIAQTCGCIVDGIGMAKPHFRVRN